MQRDLVFFVLYGSIYASIKLWKYKIGNIKIVPNTDNFMIFAILYFYNFILVIDTTVQNNDNEILLHFKSVRLIFMNYSV
jgi:hypothetical protein